VGWKEVSKRIAREHADFVGILAANQESERLRLYAQYHRCLRAHGPEDRVREIALSYAEASKAAAELEALHADVCRDAGMEVRLPHYRTFRTAGAR